MAHKQAVAGVIVRDESGRYLLVQEQRKDVRGKWNLPAGRVDPGEAPDAAAVRETKEESDYDVELVGTPLFEGFIASAGRTFYVYEATVIGGEKHVDPHEALDAASLSYPEIVALHDVGLVRTEHFFDIITKHAQAGS